MTAKEYLQQIRKDEIKINQLTEEVGDLRGKIVFFSAIDYSKDRVQTSLDGTPGILKTVEKLYDAETELNRTIGKFEEEKQRIIAEIQGLDKSEHIELLYMRYVNYMSLEEICVEMKYSYPPVKRIHGRALQAFYNKFLKDATK